jgi:hypothetical protein
VLVFWRVRGAWTTRGRSPRDAIRRDRSRFHAALYRDVTKHHEALKLYHEALRAPSLTRADCAATRCASVDDLTGGGRMLAAINTGFEIT